MSDPELLSYFPRRELSIQVVTSEFLDLCLNFEGSFRNRKQHWLSPDVSLHRAMLGFFAVTVFMKFVVLFFWFSHRK